jgi:MFS family permease
LTRQNRRHGYTNGRNACGGLYDDKRFSTGTHFLSLLDVRVSALIFLHMLTPDYATPVRHDPYAALRSLSFRQYVVGLIANTVGEQMVEAAVAWDLYARTKDPMSLFWVGLIIAVIVMVMAIPAGHLADRLPRRGIVIVTQLCAMGAIFGLALASWLNASIGLIYLMVAAAALCKAIGSPARSAWLPTLVPRRNFANAVSWQSSGFQLAATFGPAIAGFLIVRTSAPAYCVAAVTAGFFAVMAFFIDPASRPADEILAVLPTDSSDASAKPPVLDDAPPPERTIDTLLAGARFVFSTKIILATITLDLFAVLLGGATYLLPIYARDILHVGSQGYGYLRAAPAIGAVTMAMVIAHSRPFKHAGQAMLLAVAGFGAATIVFGISRNFWLSLFMLFLTGALDNISVLVRHTLVQVLTPDAMRGRVSAINSVFISSSNELGGAESAATARLFGTIPAVVIGGIGTLLTVAAVALIWPQVGQFGALHDAKPIDTPQNEPLIGGHEPDIQPRA